VYFEECPWVQDAQAREKKLKKWKRQWEIDLIEKGNPEWLDLAESWWKNTRVMNRDGDSIIRLRVEFGKSAAWSAAKQSEMEETSLDL
jgi:hypothetical protein